MSLLHPALMLFIIAVVVALTHGKTRQIVLLVGTALTVAVVFRLRTDTMWLVRQNVAIVNDRSSNLLKHQA